MAAHWLAGRQIRQTLAAEVYTPVLYLITALLLALCLPLSGGFRMPLSALPYMAGLVIGSTLLGHAVFAYALSGVSANVISFALLGEPVGAMIFSMIFFGEVPTWPVALGGLLTLMGLALYLAFAGGEKAARLAPQVFFQIHGAILPQAHALHLQQQAVRLPAAGRERRAQSALPVDHAVAGHIRRSHAQGIPHGAGGPRAADPAGNLPVGGHAPARDLPHGGIDPFKHSHPCAPFAPSSLG